MYSHRDFEIARIENRYARNSSEVTVTRQQGKAVLFCSGRNP
jgi:hypothetical protein